MGHSLDNSHGVRMGIHTIVAHFFAFRNVSINLGLHGPMNLFLGGRLQDYKPCPEIPIIPIPFKIFNTFANNPKIWGRFAAAL